MTAPGHGSGQGRAPHGRSALPTYAGGHLGALVAPLVDGQLRASTAERAWAHVLRCQVCTESVRRQSWVKNQLLLTRPVAAPDSLAERLCALPGSLEPEPAPEATWGGWSRSSRVAATLGVGGVSAAAFVVAAWVGLPAVSGPVGASLPTPAPTPPSTVEVSHRP